MKTTKFSQLAQVALAISVATGSAGCLLGSNGGVGDAPPANDPRTALVQSLDQHITQLISGINQVVIEGKFLAAMQLQNPPQPIPVQSNQDIANAIDYLLAGGVQDNTGKIVTYTPDPRFCSEEVAKNNPDNCELVMQNVRLVQTVADSTSGTLAVQYQNFTPFVISYGPDAIAASGSLPDITSTISAVNALLVAHGEQDMGVSFGANSGVFHAVIAKSGEQAVTAALSVDQAIHFDMTDSGGHENTVDVPAAQNLIAVTLDSGSLTGSVALDVPATDVHAYIYDPNGVARAAEFAFPGESGTLSLDDAAQKLAASGFKLAGTASVLIDGQQLLQLSAGELDAELDANAGTQTLSFSQFLASATVSDQDGIIGGSGTLSLSIAQGTQIEGENGVDQLKLLAGEIQLQGTGDFAQGGFDATAGSCMQGNSGNGGAPVQIAACTF